jgi:methyltransferase family protein
VAPFQLDYDPMATDPARWGHSLGNVGELLFACLDAAAPRSLVEVGAYAGDVTRMLVAWAEGAPIERLVSIDPEPQPALEALAAEHPELELVRATSVDALPTLAAADAYIVDGDHNYYTVSEELRLIDAAAPDRLPLLLCHDVCWPHARRDSYYTPEAVPPEDRQPMAEGGCLYPGVSGVQDCGLVYKWPAAREGGSRNGVLTAIEDFVAGRDEIRFAVIPAFFGLGILWARGAPYAEALEQLVGPLDRNPVLERLEANRVLHLAALQCQYARAERFAESIARKDAVLRKLLQSGAFAVAVAVSRLRQRGEPAFSKDEIRRVLPESEG